MKKDSVYIQQILEAIDKIRQFTAGMTQEQFFQDEKTQSAVIMQLALIGELAKRTSDAAKSTLNLPWKEIAGFRDRAIHDYFEVDLSVVWDTVTLDLAPLELVLKSYKGE